MKKVLAIGASNSSKSINKVLANYIAGRLENVEISLLDWTEITLPIYGVDLEESEGIPRAAEQFKEMIAESDAIVLSLAEHNGLPSTAFKNLWDWTSRIDQKFWANKPMFLAATSPGARGASGTLDIMKSIMPYFGGNVISDFSFPTFYDNFRDGKVINPELETDLKNKIEIFQKSI